jgi:CubicO group peptidase (beta-lactamase class C family)
MAIRRIWLLLIASQLLLTGQAAIAAEQKAKRVSDVHTLEGQIASVAVAGRNWPRMHSLLVSQGGQLVYEEYFNGRGRDSLDNVKSVSKSVLSALIGIAIARGDISSVDATLSDYFGREIGNGIDSTVGRITVENLLTMQAGLEPTSNSNYGAWVASNDWIGSALHAPLEAKPGEKMLYSTGNTHLLSAILTRATGRSTLQYARETLTKPLGFKLAPWPRDPQGVYFGGNDMEFTPRQLLDVGELYLNGGRAGGIQVIPQRWVKASLAPHARSPHGDARYYGYGWWVCELAGYVVPHAWGHGGQFIMLVPDLDLVIVTTSSTSPCAASQHHANNVYGLLQRIIRVVDNSTNPTLYYAAQRTEPRSEEPRPSNLF